SEVTSSLDVWAESRCLRLDGGFMRLFSRGPLPLVVLSLIPFSFASAQDAPTPTPSSPPPVAETPAPPGGEPQPTAPLPVYNNAAAGSKVFNPDMAVIGDFLGAAGKNDSKFATPALELHEAEASFQAVVDPYARADFFLTFSNDEVGVEEGFVTFTAL